MASSIYGVIGSHAQDAAFPSNVNGYFKANPKVKREVTESLALSGHLVQMAEELGGIYPSINSLITQNQICNWVPLTFAQNLVAMAETQLCSLQDFAAALLNSQNQAAMKIICNALEAKRQDPAQVLGIARSLLPDTSAPVVHNSAPSVSGADEGLKCGEFFNANPATASKVSEELADWQRLQRCGEALGAKYPDVNEFVNTMRLYHRDAYAAADVLIRNVGAAEVTVADFDRALRASGNLPASRILRDNPRSRLNAAQLPPAPPPVPAASVTMPLSPAFQPAEPPVYYVPPSAFATVDQYRAPVAAHIPVAEPACAQPGSAASAPLVIPRLSEKTIHSMAQALADAPEPAGLYAFAIEPPQAATGDVASRVRNDLQRRDRVEVASNFLRDWLQWEGATIENLKVKLRNSHNYAALAALNRGDQAPAPVDVAPAAGGGFNLTEKAIREVATRMSEAPDPAGIAAFMRSDPLAAERNEIRALQGRLTREDSVEVISSYLRDWIQRPGATQGGMRRKLQESHNLSSLTALERNS